MKRTDPGHLETDKELAKLEKQISKEYTQAYKDVKKKFEKYMKDFARKDKVKRELVKSGQLSQEEYIEWRKNQLLVGQRWEEMRDALAKDITNTQRIATSMTKEFLPDAYAINHNYGTFEVEKGSHINTSYTLYDRDTVNRLIRDNPKLLPAPKVDIPKAQLWNKRKLTSAITQGVLQGEAIPAIAKRLMTVTDMSKSAAIRNARTMTTSAECAGRIDSYKRAEDMGIEMQQAWVATLDDRTRHEHRLLDGQIRPVGEPFEVEGQKILYPGDPAAEPYLVYNCRCTVIALVKGTSLENGIGDYPRILDPALGDMTYEEWKGAHEEQQEKQEITMKPFVSTKVKNVLGNDFDEFAELVNKSETNGVFNKYSDECRSYKKSRNGGSYMPALDAIDFSYSKSEGQSKYSVFAHECGHMFDKKIGRHGKISFSEIDKLNQHCIIGSGSVKIFKEVPSSCDEFLSALRKDAETLKPLLDNRSIVKEMKDTIKSRNASAGVQDFLDGLFSTQDNRILPWGHGDRYYNRAYNQKIKRFNLDKDLQTAFTELGFDASNQTKVKRLSRLYETSSEAWANINSAVTCGGPELEAFEKYMPETVKTFKSILRRIE